jgi:hypothetical protein
MAMRSIYSTQNNNYNTKRNLRLKYCNSEQVGRHFEIIWQLKF